MLAFRDETKEQELWVVVKCKPGTEVLASASQRQWWHPQSSTSVIRPRGTCLTVIINCPQIQFLNLRRHISHLQINQDFFFFLSRNNNKKKYGIPRYSRLFYSRKYLRGILKICNLMCPLQPKRLCMSILIVIPFLYSFWGLYNSLWWNHRTYQQQDASWNWTST